MKDDESKERRLGDKVLIPILKGNGDIQECNNYRGIKLLSAITHF